MQTKKSFADLFSKSLNLWSSLKLLAAAICSETLLAWISKKSVRQRPSKTSYFFFHPRVSQIWKVKKKVDPESFKIALHNIIFFLFLLQNKFFNAAPLHTVLATVADKIQLV